MKKKEFVYQFSKIVKKGIDGSVYSSKMIAVLLMMMCHPEMIPKENREEVLTSLVKFTESLLEGHSTEAGMWIQDMLIETMLEHFPEDSKTKEKLDAIYNP